jgi:hypothetical protein
MSKLGNIKIYSLQNPDWDKESLDPLGIIALEQGPLPKEKGT